MYGLLAGIDPEAVSFALPNPTSTIETDEVYSDAPEYPLTISVEDSYNVNMTFSEALARLTELAMSLLTRLEIELVEEPAQVSGSSTLRFVRYPRQVKLGTRVSGCYSIGSFRLVRD